MREPHAGTHTILPYSVSERSDTVPAHAHAAISTRNTSIDDVDDPTQRFYVLHAHDVPRAAAVRCVSRTGESSVASASPVGCGVPGVSN